MAVTSKPQVPQNGENEDKIARPRRPNYNKLHSQPLPFTVFPLPPLIPNNPLSLLHIAYTYLSQLIIPPSPYPKGLYQGIFSPETRSVHVTDNASIRALWEHGFFGKGSLSRSEPTWLEGEKIKRGLVVGETAEEVTRRRREERKQFKKERARKEREAIEEKLAEERGTDSKEIDRREKQEIPAANGNVDIASSTASAKSEQRSPRETASQNLPPEQSKPPDGQSKPEATESPSLSATAKQTSSDLGATADTSPFIDQEHLQLTLEEAFFLSYGLGILAIHTPTEPPQRISSSHLLPLFRAYSYFPPLPFPTTNLKPDDPFLLSYVTYHHFRSLGWVVRPGMKFAVDYLLYNRGPVFSHAEFAVIVLPSYSHAHWKKSEGEEIKKGRGGRKSWWWVHSVNRVQAQVRKSLVICWVEVPPPTLKEDDRERLEDVGALLRRYKVREMVLKRWTPNRSRD